MATAQPALQESLTSHLHNFLQPTSDLHNAAIQLAKQYFDPLADGVTRAQLSRQRRERDNRKRKRAFDDHDRPTEQLLRMKQIHVDGFGVEQVWQQAIRVLDATGDEVIRGAPGGRTTGENKLVNTAAAQRKVVRFDDDLEDNDDVEDGSLGEEGIDWEVEGEDDNPDAAPGLSSDVDGDDEDEADSLEEGSPDLGAETPLSDVSDDTMPAETIIKDKHGLNDGFFSIEQFNKRSEFLEHQDAKGDPNDGAASDEEEIDWTADPLSAGAHATVGKTEARKSNKTTRKDDADDEDNEDGATFGNADLDAPDTDDEDEALSDGEDMMAIGGDFSNTNDIQYADFFAPPARSKRPTIRRSRHKRPQDQSDRLAKEDVTGSDDDNTEMNRAIADVHRDIFEDEEEDDLGLASASDSENENVLTNANLSTHERRLAAFRREIAKLERENVANKPWALSGETLAPARPENALLEEDLDFERAGKPVPVITNEVNESIEELIRRRILANEFDELPRRRPELSNADGSRRGLVDRRKEELSDAKPNKGLADEYADDYLRRNDPNFVDSRSQATKTAHAVIASQWADLSAQLDSLSNYHYKPRPPEKSLEVRTDAPVIQMEEARPAAGAEASASGLAPQEIHKLGSEGHKDGEIITTGGTAVSKEEETRESKQRRRRREKSRAKKAIGSNGAAVAASNGNQTAANTAEGPKRLSRKADQQNVVSALKKGNVKVIGKKGELQDVEGKSASTNAHGGRTGTAAYML